MPDAIQQVRRLNQQATKTVAAVEQESAKREQELAVLKAAAARWESVLREQPTNGGVAVPGQTRRTTKRLDWGAILGRLPDTFTAKVVAARTGKPLEQVYAGITRWTKEKKVRKGPDGYHKVGAASPPRSAGTAAKAHSPAGSARERT